MLRLAHCRVGEDGVGLFGEDLPGDASLGRIGAGFRIVDGVWMVFLRIDDGVGLLGERFDNGAGRSISCCELSLTG